MSLILKSNNALQLKKITDAVSNPKLYLDFRDGDFKKNGAALANASEALKNTRNAISYGLDAFGNSISSIHHTLLVSSDLEGSVKGVNISGKIDFNQFLNSFSPVTQSVTITKPATNKAYIVQVIGSGHIKVSIDGVQTAIATQDNPYVYTTKETTQKVFNLEVVGDLYYAALLETSTGRVAQALIKTSSLNARGAIDWVTVLPSVVSEILPSGVGTIVIRQKLNSVITKAANFPIFTNTAIAVRAAAESLTNQINLVSRDNHSSNYAIRSQFDGNETLLQSNEPLQDDNVFALTLGTTESKGFVNGLSLGTVPRSNTTIHDISLASSSLWGGVQSENFLVEVAVYDRVLTDDELKVITTI